MGEAVERPMPERRSEPVESHPDVHVQRGLLRCPFCHDEVRADEASTWVACGSCLARHHGSCWREAARCGTCGGATALAPARSTTRATLFGVLGLMALVLTLAALTAVLYASTERHAPPAPPPPRVARAAFAGETASVTQLRDRADAGDASAMFEVACALATGQGVGIDRREAAAWYRRAGASGHARACLAYADLLQRGAPNAGIAQDVEEARLWVRRAAEQGSGEAAYRYAQLADAREWLTWSRRAAALGNVAAMNALASRLMQPGASGEDLAEVEALCARADAAAVPIVMTRLGDALWERDHERALAWYRRAAERGDPDALARYPRALGELGRLEEADEGFRRAVAAGVPIRLQELGLLRARDAAAQLLLDQPVAAVLPFNDPHVFTIELEAGVTYVLAVTTDLTDSRFWPELVVRDAASRVIDAPRGLLGDDRRARGRAKLTPLVSGRYYLQIHGQLGELRRYTLLVRPVQ